MNYAALPIKEVVKNSKGEEFVVLELVEIKNHRGTGVHSIHANFINYACPYSGHTETHPVCIYSTDGSYGDCDSLRWLLGHPVCSHEKFIKDTHNGDVELTLHNLGMRGAE